MAAVNQQPQPGGGTPSTRQLVFLVDTTAAMAPHLATLRENYIEPLLRTVVEQSLQKKEKVELVMVAFRDLPPAGNYVVRVSSFTRDIKQLMSWMERLDFAGGGQPTVPLADALAAACQVIHERSTKERFFVLVTNNAPYHQGVPTRLYAMPGQPLGTTVADIAVMLAKAQIALSIIAPRQLSELDDIFKKATIPGLSETRNAKPDSQHMVLLRGLKIAPTTSASSPTGAPAGAPQPASTATATPASANGPPVGLPGTAAGPTGLSSGVNLVATHAAPVQLNASPSRSVASGMPPGVPPLTSGMGISAVGTVGNPGVPTTAPSMAPSAAAAMRVAMANKAAVPTSVPMNVTASAGMQPALKKAKTDTGPRPIHGNIGGMNVPASYTGNIPGGVASASPVGAPPLLNPNAGDASKRPPVMPPTANTGVAPSPVGVKPPPTVINLTNSSGNVPTPSSMTTTQTPVAQPAAPAQQPASINAASQTKVWEGSLAWSQNQNVTVLCTLAAYPRSKNDISAIAKDWPNQLVITGVIPSKGALQMTYQAALVFQFQVLKLASGNQGQPSPYTQFINQLLAKSWAGIVSLPSNTLFIIPHKDMLLGVIHSKQNFTRSPAPAAGTTAQGQNPQGVTQAMQAHQAQVQAAQAAQAAAAARRAQVQPAVPTYSGQLGTQMPSVMGGQPMHSGIPQATQTVSQAGQGVSHAGFSAPQPTFAAQQQGSTGNHLHSFPHMGGNHYMGQNVNGGAAQPAMNFESMQSMNVQQQYFQPGSNVQLRPK